MNKFLCNMLLVLILPVAVVAFDMEAKLRVSGNVHMLLQILIVLVVGRLVWAWIQFNEACALREEDVSRRVHILK